MARPRKEGLDYFPLDTNMDLTDDKIQLIEGLYGAVGFATIIKLFMKIYNTGYFYKWGEAEQILMAKRIGIEVNSLKNIANDCIKYGLFQEKLFNDHNLLTSKGIQKRYFSACGKKKTGEVFKEYLLIDDKLLLEMCPKIIVIRLFQEKPLVIPNLSTQIKQNKTKQNKTKQNIYENVLNYWNEKSDLNKITAMSDKRKSNINARIKDFDLETIYKVIDMTNDSDFLSGKSTEWKATFDWVLNPTNFIKVLEGNYVNRSKPKDKSPCDFNDIGIGGERHGKYKQTIFFPDER